MTASDAVRKRGEAARWEVEWALGYLEHRRSYKGKKHRRRMDKEAAKALRAALESMSVGKQGESDA